MTMGGAQTTPTGGFAVSDLWCWLALACQMREPPRLAHKKRTNRPQYRVPQPADPHPHPTGRPGPAFPSLTGPGTQSPPPAPPTASPVPHSFPWQSPPAGIRTGNRPTASRTASAGPWPTCAVMHLFGVRSGPGAWGATCSRVGEQRAAGWGSNVQPGGLDLWPLAWPSCCPHTLGRHGP